MRRSSLLTAKLALKVALPAALVLGVSSVVFAQAGCSDSSPFSYGPVDGVSYYNNAEICVYDGSDVSGSTFVSTQNSVTVPAGWMGAEARIYRKDGQEVGNTGMEYDASSGSSYGVQQVIYPASNGTFDSRGQSVAWNGAGYNAPYWTYFTPYLSYTTTASTTSSSPSVITSPRGAPAFRVNAAGQTYGSDMNASGPSQEPDLVWVQATNGKSGYVYAKQLNPPLPKTIQQALASNAQYPRVIPVYKKNGATVIGQFVVGKDVNSFHTVPSSPQG